MSDNSARRSNAKIFIVYIAFAILGVACFAQILALGIKDRSLYMGTSDRCLDKTVENWQDSPLAGDPDCNCVVVKNNRKPRRGDIYDDQGRILAGSIVIYDITLDGETFRKAKPNKKYLDNPQKLDSLIDHLSYNFYHLFKNKFTRNDIQYYKKRFTRSLKGGENVQILQSNLNDEKRWITKNELDKIKEMPLLNTPWNISGLNASERMVRMNPYGEMGRRCIGREINGNWNGLEYEFNDQLYGVDGSNKVVYVNNIAIPLNENIYPEDGNHIHTTINLEMQNIVHNELLKVLKEYKAEWGCAVLMETQSGEVKAISNLTRTDTSARKYVEHTNYVINYMLEPGSTFKLASLLAFLERTPDDSAKKYPMLAHRFTGTNKSGREYNYVKRDEAGKKESEGYPIEIFQRSSNVGIAAMIFDKFDSYKDYLSKIDSLYITTSFSTQLGKVKSPNIKRNAKDFHNYYNTCYGTGFKMTPIQTLIYYNAIANNGKMVVPLFVRSITRNRDTLIRYEAEVIADQICSQHTIDRAKEYLESVVTGEFGTARYYRNANFTFAGKTGTRDIWDEKTGGYDRRHNCVSFCGYFPADTPKYTCVIYIYDVPKKSSIAVNAFSKMAQGVLNVTHYEALPVINQTVAKKMPQFNVILGSRLETIFEEMGIDQTVPIETPYVKSRLNENKERTVRPYDFATPENAVPDVRNMAVADAIYELNKAGYKAEIEGKGVVREQTHNKSTATVKLRLSP